MKKDCETCLFKGARSFMKFGCPDCSSNDYRDYIPKKGCETCASNNRNPDCSCVNFKNYVCRHIDIEFIMSEEVYIE